MIRFMARIFSKSRPSMFWYFINTLSTLFCVFRSVAHSRGLSGNCRYRGRIDARIMSPPTSAIPNPKEPASPMIPITIGMTPPPIRKAGGIAKETAKFRAPGGPIRDRATNAAGGKQTAKMGWTKTKTKSP